MDIIALAVRVYCLTRFFALTSCREPPGKPGAVHRSGWESELIDRGSCYSIRVKWNAFGLKSNVRKGAMLILIAEDDRKTGKFLHSGLREAGHVVDVVRDGEAALDCALSKDYDVIVLDIMLPLRDGWSVLTEIRQTGMEVPVLLLTARDLVTDRVRGLDLGADDYLVKPFAFSELLARIRALARRGIHTRPEIFELADLVVDLARVRAERAGQELRLSPKEFSLLELLVSRAGEVVSRAVIAEKVWDMHFASDMNVIDVTVARLRAKADAPFSVKLIHTVKSVGYILEVRR